MNKKIINILCLTLMSFFVKAQKIDSLIEVLKTTNDHIEKTSTLYEIGLLQQNTDSALYYFKKALRVSKNATNSTVPSITGTVRKPHSLPHMKKETNIPLIFS